MGANCGIFTRGDTQKNGWSDLENRLRELREPFSGPEIPVDSFGLPNICHLSLPDPCSYPVQGLRLAPLQISDKLQEAIDFPVPEMPVKQEGLWHFVSSNKKKFKSQKIQYEKDRKMYEHKWNLALQQCSMKKIPRNAWI